MKAYRRWRARDADPYARAMLEAVGYRRSMYRFMAATIANPGLLHDADLDESSVVVDVGAYHGEWAEPVSQRYGSTIHAFEPSPGAARKLRERLRGHANVIVHECALGAADGLATLQLAGPGSTFGSTAGAGAVEVEVRDVVAVLDGLGLDRVDLLKLNIEGAEFDLLDRLIGAGWLPRIRQVSVQFHDTVPHAHRRRRAIRRALRATHDERWCYAWVWELWGRRVAG